MSLLEQSVTYKPFKYQWAFDASVKHEQSHWGEWEVSLQDDVDQWKMGTITPTEKEHVTQILRLFTQSDVAVGTNYLEHYIPTFKNNEVRAMLTSFANREFVHQRAYALLNDTLGLEEAEYSAFLEYKEMREKVDFMGEVDMHTHAGKAMGLVQSVINEGVGLFSAFAMLLNFQQHQKLLGTNKIVEWSVRDESMHCQGMLRLFREHCEEHPRIVNDEFKKEIYERFRREVKLEDKVIEGAFPDGKPINGHGPDDYKKYVRFLADRRLIQLGLNSNWHVRKNPLRWLDWVIDGDSFNNFFEQRNADYTAKGMTGDFGWDT